MSYIKLGVIVFSLFAVTAFVWASESDEIRENAKAMQREAAELAEQGHKEEAANLKRQAMAMLEEAGNLDRGGVDERHSEIMKLRLHLEKLRQEERKLEEVGEAAGGEERLDAIRREAEVIQDKLRHMLRESHDEHGGPHDDIARRLEHMRIAVDHLNQAGLHDIAEHVAQRAEATERELHEQQQHQGGDVMHEIMKQLDEIRNEVGRLRDEVHELKEKR
jgi:methyl-accepting chemotaxis protein